MGQSIIAWLKYCKIIPIIRKIVPISMQITYNGESKRADLAVAGILGVSRSQIQKLFKAGRVLVNDRISTAHLALVDGDQIVVEQWGDAGDEMGSAFESAARTDLHRTDPVTLSVVYEDADLLVIDKPAGLLSHETKVGSGEMSVASLFKTRNPEVSGVGPVGREGLVHRLDKAASGLMMLAKTEASFDFLKRQFADRLVKKTYTALVLGKVEPEYGMINFPIARSKSKPRMAARPTSQEGLMAVTHYDVERRFTTATLVAVGIETGRTHQIRAHFFALGHQVAGDTLYVQRGVKLAKLDRLFLHASKLEFTLPSGEQKTFTSPLPQELEAYLLTLKSI